MSVFRINKTKNYTVMSNHHLREKKMSLKAKGLLSMMLSLPDDWNYSIAGLVSICKENETAIKSTLKELSDFGYVRIDKLPPSKTESGRFEYIYNIYEEPQKQQVEKQGVENLPLESQEVENQVQLNTNKQNTKKLNTKEKKGKSKKEKFLDSISNKLQEYDFKQTVEEKILGFFEMWFDNGYKPPVQSIEAQLNLLATMGLNEQLNSIDTSIRQGWRSLAYENSSKPRRGFVDTAPQDLKWNKEQREIHKGMEGVKF